MTVGLRLDTELEIDFKGQGAVDSKEGCESSSPPSQDLPRCTGLEVGPQSGRSECNEVERLRDS